MHGISDAVMSRQNLTIVARAESDFDDRIRNGLLFVYAQGISSPKFDSRYTAWNICFGKLGLPPQGGKGPRLQI